MKGWPWKRVRMETWMLCRSCPEFHWNQFHSNGTGVSSTVLRQGEDLAEDPGKAVTRRVTLWKSWAAFPGRSFMTSQHFVFSCKGRIWDSTIYTYGICRCCWNQQGTEWEICTPKYWTLPWGLPKKQSDKLLLRPVRIFDLLQRLCTLEGTMQLFSKPREPVWVNQAPHKHFVISLYRLRNPACRTGVGCTPKQKSINI